MPYAYALTMLLSIIDMFLCIIFLRIVLTHVYMRVNARALLFFTPLKEQEVLRKMHHARGISVSPRDSVLDSESLSHAKPSQDQPFL